MQQINHTNMYSAIENNDYLVVLFSAPWCTTCKQIHKIIDSINVNDLSHITFTEMNLDESSENTELAEAFDVTSIPVIKMFKEGEEVFSHYGLISKNELVLALADKLNK